MSYYTQSFTEAVPAPAPYQKGDSENAKFLLVAARLGYYFEGAVYEELSKLAGGGGGSMQGTAAKAQAALSDPQALGFLRTSAGAFKFTPAQMQELMRTARSQAQSIAAAIDARIRSQMTSKDYYVSQIGDAGEIAGDIKAIVEGKTIIYECKYQMASGAKVRWFELNEAQLFGGGFGEWLAQPAQKKEKWSYKMTPQQWKYMMRMDAMEEYLKETGSGEGMRETFRRLMQKGQSGKDKGYDKKEIIYASNIYTGGDNMRAETVIDMDSLIDWVESSDVFFSRSGEGAYFRIQAANKEIGTFGMSHFQKGEPGTDPRAANFEFEMKLAQDLFYR